MVCLLPGETKVSWAENSDAVSRDGADDSGAENTAVAPPRGALLWAGDGAGWDFRWRREEDQEDQEDPEDPAGWEEEEEEEGAAAC